MTVLTMPRHSNISVGVIIHFYIQQKLICLYFFVSRFNVILINALSEHILKFRKNSFIKVNLDHNGYLCIGFWRCLSNIQYVSLK